MEDFKSYLSFKIGEEYYAASVGYVHNIIEHTQITKVPEMPEYMLGIINLRGTVLPVVDSRLKFGTTNTQINTNTCILVSEVTVGKEQLFVGLLVDSVAEVLEIEKEEIKDPPNLGEMFKANFIEGVYHDGEKFVMILDMNKIFAREEIKQFQKTAKKAEVKV